MLFYSVDNSGNIEKMRWNDVFVDCFAPTSSIDEIIVNKRNINISVSAHDIGVGVDKVSLYYRYSPDNLTWGSWIYAGDNWSCGGSLCLLPDGYYEFYTVAYDLLGNHEKLPNETVSPKARCVISYPWDINLDGRINVEDVYIVITHWMTTPSDENWLPEADVNKDGIIDAYDIMEMVDNWTG